MSRTDEPSSVTGAVFDHVAVAVERWADAWPRYAVELGGRWGSGGENVGFAPAQLRYANGGGVEILQPWQSEANPFLRRFLDHNGPGPHHMTFKVKDIAGALDDARARGFNPVGVSIDNPYWMEAFLHPRQATGVVVQLAQASEDWASSPPEGFPERLREPAADLLRVTHAVTDMDYALGLFCGLLGATRGPEGIPPDGTWTYADLSWNGPLHLRLIAPTEGASHGAVSSWINGRPGRVHHLAFSFEEAGREEPVRYIDRATVPGVLVSEDVEVIEPSANLGTRLVVLRGDQGPRS
jgi:hypothetical protein